MTQLSKARLCHLVKIRPDQEYGFDLHTERSRGIQYIGTVDDDSPAQLAGLRQNDRLLAVNGAPVQRETHKQVVARIRQDPLQCYLTVQADDDNVSPVSTPLPHEIDTGDHAIADRSDYSTKSFELRVGSVAPSRAETQSSSDSKSPSAPNPADDGSGQRYADQAKLVVETDNSSPKNLPLNAPQQLHFESVACNGGLEAKTNNFGPEAKTNYDGFETKVYYDGFEAKANNCDFDAQANCCGLEAKADNCGLEAKTINGGLEAKKSIPPTPKWCRLIKHSKSSDYGFNLMSEKRSGFFIGKVDPGSVAQAAGLTESLRVVGINYRIIEPNMPYKDIIALVLKYPLHVTLLVVTEDVHHYYCLNKLTYDFNEAEPLRPRSPVSLYERVGTEFGNNADIQYKSNPDLHSEVQYRNNLPKPTPASRTRPVSMYAHNTCNSPARSIILSDNFFRMSVAEVKQMIAQHKKVDPRHSAIPLIEKYNIVRNL